MKRAAILIEASAVPGQKFLPGAVKDLNIMKDWLTRNEGGAWEPSEIQTLSNPKWSDLLPRLNLCKTVDYFFLAFSGHGDHLKVGSSSVSRIMLTATDLIEVTKLNVGFNKGVFLFDSCREVVTMMSLATESIETRVKKFASATPRATFRKLYDEQIASAAPGVISMYSCAQGSVAGENADGGYFTAGLIGAGNAWALAKTPAGVLSLDKAFGQAVENVHVLDSTQNPVMEGSIRRSIFYPFAVRA